MGFLLYLKKKKMTYKVSYEAHGHMKDMSIHTYERTLVHYCLNKTADILQTFSNAISWMNIIAFLFKFHLFLFLSVQSTVGQNQFR